MWYCRKRQLIPAISMQAMFETAAQNNRHTTFTSKNTYI